MALASRPLAIECMAKIPIGQGEIRLQRDRLRQSRRGCGELAVAQKRRAKRSMRIRLQRIRLDRLAQNTDGARAGGGRFSILRMPTKGIADKPCARRSDARSHRPARQIP